ncbi:MAG: hypothetical protein AAF750_10960 [Planctomycetota bacterium]
MTLLVLPVWGWVVAGLAAVVIVVVVGFFVLIFVTGLFETHHLLGLDYLPGDGEQPMPTGKAGQQYDEALAAGCLAIGAFEDRESKLMSLTLWLLISEDGRDLVMITSKPRMLGYRIYSRLESGVWLTSGEVVGNTDLTGLVRPASHPGEPLAGVLSLHRQRADTAEEPVVPFIPEQLLDDLLAFDRKKAETTIAMGLGRWVNAEQTQWRHTPRGALRLTAQTAFSGGTDNPRNDEVENLISL